MEIKKEPKVFSKDKLIEILSSALLLDIQEVEVEEESFLTRIIRELSEIRGKKVDVKRPVEVAEFLYPEKDFEKEDKISLYDLLNYLVSEERGSFLCAVAHDVPYFLSKTPMNNKYKALARLECQMLGVSEEAILYYLQHNDHKVSEDGIIVSCLLPEVLCDKRINDYLVDPEDKEISFMRGLFQDEKINRMAGLVYHSRQENPKQFNKNPSN